MFRSGSARCPDDAGDAALRCDQGLMSVCPLIAVAFFAAAFFAVAFFAGTVYLPSDVVLSCPVITSLKAPRGKRPKAMSRSHPPR